eukprot:s55_g14.t1
MNLEFSIAIFDYQRVSLQPLWFRPVVCQLAATWQGAKREPGLAFQNDSHGRSKQIRWWKPSKPWPRRQSARQSR